MGTDDNLADALTKGVDAYSISKHVTGAGMELKDDRHRMAPVLEKEASAELKLEGE